MFAKPLGVICFVAAAAAIVIAVTATPEWTCKEVGSDWTCVGPTCNVEANARFDKTRKTMQCDRTDWAVGTLGKIVNAVLPKPDGKSTKPGA
jgi:hypothetical protein